MSDHLQESKPKVTGHLEERGGKYHMALSWTDKYGVKGRKSCTTGLAIKNNKKRAEEILRKKRAEKLAELEQSQGLGKQLFADFMEQWLETMRNEVKPSTFGRYQVSVQHVIVPYFRQKGILLRDITAGDVNTFYDKQKERVSASTVRNYHVNIGKAIRYAIKNEMSPCFVMEDVKKPKAEPYTAKFYSESEIVQLCNVVRGHKLELGVIFGAFYGLRRSEILGLRWQSINFDTNTITIEHTLIETKIDGKLVRIADDSTKSRSSLRVLPLIPVFRARLLEIKAEQERNKKMFGKDYNKTGKDYVYVDVQGNLIKPNYISVEFPKFLEKNGLRRIRFHDLRHSCASSLHKNGMSMKHIQEWLGHSEYSITANLYTHLDVDSKIQSANSMTWINSTPLGQDSAEQPVTTVIR